MQAKRKEIRKIPLEQLEVDVGNLAGLEVARLYFEESADKAEILEGDTDTVVQMLVEKLRKEARVI